MGWYNPSWTYRVKITVLASKVDADLTDFPVYVNLNNLPVHFHTNCNQTDCRDIRVTKSDGVTEVPREVVFYTSGTDAGELHFKASGTLSGSTDTDFFIYYGNAGATEPSASSTYGSQNVWNSSYKAVHHLPNGTTLTANDSTATGANGTVTGATAATGKINGGAGFDGNDYIALGTINLTGAYTIAAWVKFTSISAQQNWLSNYNSAGSLAQYDCVVTSTKKIELYVDGSAGYKWWSTPADVVTTGTWYHLAVTHDGTLDNAGVSIYVNGVSQSLTPGTSGTPSIPSTAGGTAIGRAGDYAGLYTNGEIDETRISDAVRSATWISTEYNNQSSPSTFYTVGVIYTHYTIDGPTVTADWSAPATSLEVICTGGGGGGDAQIDGTGAGGAGGGGGAIAISVVTVTIGSTRDLTAGAAGTAGIWEGAAGGAGGDSYFGASVVRAKAGGGGSGSTGGAGGLASASTGDTKYDGGSGGASIGTTGGCSGGGAATVSGAGDSGIWSGGSSGADGGEGQGHGGRGGDNDDNAGLNDGQTAPGAGGGGGGASFANSGTGLPGRITIIWVVVTSVTYDNTGSGGFILGGAGIPAMPHAPTASGGAILGSAGIPALASSPVPTGGGIVGSAGTAAHTGAKTGSGGFVITSLGTPSHRTDKTSAGGFILTSVGILSHRTDKTGVGGFVIGSAGTSAVSIVVVPGSGGGVIGSAGVLTESYNVTMIGGIVLNSTGTVTEAITVASGTGGGIIGSAGGVSESITVLSGDGGAILTSAGVPGMEFIVPAADGGAIIGSVGDVSLVFLITGEGTLLVGGAGTLYSDFNPVVSGGLIIGSEGIPSAETSKTGSGGFILASAGLISAVFDEETTGTFTIAAAAQSNLFTFAIYMGVACCCTSTTTTTSSTTTTTTTTVEGNCYVCGECPSVICALCIEIISMSMVTDHPNCNPINTWVEGVPLPWIVLGLSPQPYGSNVGNINAIHGIGSFTTSLVCNPEPFANTWTWQLGAYWSGDGDGQLGCAPEVYLIDEILGIGCDFAELLGEHTVVNTELSGIYELTTTLVYRVSAGRSCGVVVPYSSQPISKILHGRFNYLLSPINYQLEWTGSRWDVTSYYQEGSSSHGVITGYLDSLDDVNWHLFLNSSTKGDICDTILTVKNYDEPHLTGTTTEGYEVQITGPN